MPSHLLELGDADDDDLPTIPQRETGCFFPTPSCGRAPGPPRPVSDKISEASFKVKRNRSALALSERHDASVRRLEAAQITRAGAVYFHSPASSETTMRSSTQKAATPSIALQSAPGSHIAQRVRPLLFQIPAIDPLPPGVLNTSDRAPDLARPFRSPEDVPPASKRPEMDRLLHGARDDRLTGSARAVQPRPTSPRRRGFRQRRPGPLPPRQPKFRMPRSSGPTSRPRRHERTRAGRRVVSSSQVLEGDLRRVSHKRSS